MKFQKRAIVQFFSFAVLFLFIQIGYAQTPTQTVRGRVVDAANNQPLVGANVQLIGTELVAAVDTEGVFKIQNVPVGRYSLKTSFIGYAPNIISEFWVQSGKEVVFDISLSVSKTELDEITVISSNSSRNTICTAEITTLTDPFSRYPATFNDPARAITYLAGAATDNDQGNNISVRGNTPNALQWYLEGAEIVNPNHLSNAGTPSDRTTANGGGTLILGTNMMESATFYKGAMASDMGGALTSIMDLKLRKGNDQKRQTSISLGLIGLEAGTEGYFGGDREQGTGDRKAQKASYLLHYRYSTVGLLSKMGVPLGDEAISYQDLTYNFNFPTEKAGNFNLFGMHGGSDNVFKNKPRKDWNELTTEKDSQNISFKNLMQVVGVKHSIGLGKNTVWNTVAAYSWLKNSREATGYNALEKPILFDNFNNDQSKFFVKTKIDWQLQNGVLHLGTVVKKEGVEYEKMVKNNSISTTQRVKGQDYWLQPFAEWSSNTDKKFQYQLGLRGSILTQAKQARLEPSLRLLYNTSNTSALSLNMSNQSQTLSPFVYISNDTAFQFSQSANLNLNYNFRVGVKTVIDISAYYEQQHVPFSTNGVSASDDLENAFRVWNNDLTQIGRNIGVEIDINHLLNKGFHWRFNTSIYDAKFGTGDFTTSSKDYPYVRNTRFNGRYIVNGLIGKEWAYGKNKNKFWGINGRILLRGGFRETPIDSVASKKTNVAVYDNTKPFSIQLKDYFRTDLSVYLKRNRLKWSSTLQLDIQNLTNAQNEAWHYYDRYQKKVLTKYQLGSIPNLSYKIDF